MLGTFLYRLIVWVFLFNTVLLLTNPQPAFSSILITELHPNPTNGEPEWVELHNPDAETVDLTNWQLWDELSSPNQLLTLQTTLAPGETKVLTLENPKLNNAADGVTLRSQAGEIIASMNYNSSEQAKSWVRTADTWSISEASPGIYQSVQSEATPHPTPSPSPTLQPTPTATAVLPSIAITEIFPCPATQEDEYIVIRNTGSATLDLNNLYITDEQQNQRQTGGLLAVGAEIKISWTADMLNTAGDTVIVRSESGVALASAEYVSCTIGEPLQLIDAAWQTRTQSIPNISSQSVPVPSPTTTPQEITKLAAAPTPAASVPSAKKKLSPVALPVLLEQSPESTQAAHIEPIQTLEYRQKNVPQVAVLSAILGSGFLLIGGAALVYGQPPKHST